MKTEYQLLKFNVINRNDRYYDELSFKEPIHGQIVSAFLTNDFDQSTEHSFATAILDVRADGLYATDIKFTDNCNEDTLLMAKHLLKSDFDLRFNARGRIDDNKHVCNVHHIFLSIGHTSTYSFAD
jgi:hypothetical protein